MQAMQHVAERTGEHAAQAEHAFSAQAQVAQRAEQGNRRAGGGFVAIGRALLARGALQDLPGGETSRVRALVRADDADAAREQGQVAIGDVVAGGAVDQQHRRARAALEHALEVARLAGAQHRLQFGQRQAGAVESEATGIAGRHQAQVQAGIGAQARQFPAQAAAQGAAHLASGAHQDQLDGGSNPIPSDRKINRLVGRC